MERNYIENARAILAGKIDVEGDLLDLYTLLALTSGVTTSWGDVHDAWAIWKNRTKPDHKSLIPFIDLPANVRKLDKEYADAIIETAKQLFSN